MISFAEVFPCTKGGFSVVHIVPVVVESSIKWCSDFPTYCAPHFRQSRRQIIFLLLQSRLCLTSYVSLISLENVLVSMSCLQHWQSLLNRQGLHLPELMDGLTTLLFEIVLLPIMSLRFLRRQ